jgi:hypothetical protein
MPTLSEILISFFINVVAGFFVVYVSTVVIYRKFIPLHLKYQMKLGIVFSVIGKLYYKQYVYMEKRKLIPYYKGYRIAYFIITIIFSISICYLSYKCYLYGYDGLSDFSLIEPTKFFISFSLFGIGLGVQIMFLLKHIYTYDIILLNIVVSNNDGKHFPIELYDEHNDKSIIELEQLSYQWRDEGIYDFTILKK